MWMDCGEGGIFEIEVRAFSLLTAIMATPTEIVRCFLCLILIFNLNWSIYPPSYILN